MPSIPVWHLYNVGGWCLAWAVCYMVAELVPTSLPAVEAAAAMSFNAAESVCIKACAAVADPQSWPLTFWMLATPLCGAVSVLLAVPLQKVLDRPARCAVTRGEEPEHGGDRDVNTVRQPSKEEEAKQQQKLLERFLTTMYEVKGPLYRS
jgi:hypothetical protein